MKLQRLLSHGNLSFVPHTLNLKGMISFFDTIRSKNFCAYPFSREVGLAPVNDIHLKIIHH